MSDRSDKSDEYASLFAAVRALTALQAHPPARWRQVIDACLLLRMSLASGGCMSANFRPMPITLPPL